jgi:putative spermidine/putrescine transport system substrate-binding protein
MVRRFGFLLVLMILAACGGQAATTLPPTSGSPAATTTPGAASADAATAAPAEPTPAGPVATSVPGAAPNLDDWAAVEQAARGQTVNWYVWGGSESINTFIDTFYGAALKERYDITLKRTPLADTVDAVNQVLSEKEAGQDVGAIDMIWINGENFLSLKQADMLYRGWARKLPNSQLVDWENPAVSLDFGEPVDDMESPWSSAQFQFI